MLEAKLLVELFPHLRDSFDKHELLISFIVAKESGRLKRRKVGRRGRRQRLGKPSCAKEELLGFEAESDEGVDGHEADRKVPPLIGVVATTSRRIQGAENG